MTWSTPISLAMGVPRRPPHTAPMPTYLGARLARALVAMALLTAQPNSCSSSGSSSIVITMELRFDPPIPATEATAIQAEYDAPSAAEAPTTVLCNHDYSSSNAVGTYHIQRACGSSAAPCPAASWC